VRSSIFFALLLASCGGGSNPQPIQPAPETAPTSSDPKGSIYGGSIAPVEVKKAIGEHKAEFKACYHSLLEKDKKASGKVVLRFTVDEEGKVEETVILNETSLPNETANCIADIVKGITFQKPVGGKARITYPWEFTAE
jgi:TonB family protein